jgi:hypothetical protein
MIANVTPKMLVKMRTVLFVAAASPLAAKLDAEAPIKVKRTTPGRIATNANEYEQSEMDVMPLM